MENNFLDVEKVLTNVRKLYFSIIFFNLCLNVLSII